MRTQIAIAAAGLCGCLSTSEPCDAPPQEVFTDAMLYMNVTQSVLTTPPAAKDCHALFTARLGYTGDDAFDPSLPRPQVDVSANAVGTGGEQPGLIGLLTSWQYVEDPDTGEIGWWAELDGAAKNIEAPAVSYGMIGVRLPSETLPVAYYAQITYQPPPEEEPAARLAIRPHRPCAAAR